MSTTVSPLDLSALVEDLFLVLTAKEKEVVIKRFSLDNKPRQTLEKIGKKFGVTRERVRQIEKIGLNKLRRTIINTKLKNISEMAMGLLNKSGGVANELKLVEELVKSLGGSQEQEGSMIKLLLSISPQFIKTTKSDDNVTFYYLKNIPGKDIDAVIRKSLQVLEKEQKVMEEGKLLTELALGFNENTYTPEFIRSALATDTRIKKIENGYGLMTWRHVNPKSIRDKAFIILKKTAKPLHFEVIAQEIQKAGFDRKSVTVQAVHNELIRYDQFVLVGRGLYGLKEWGYKEGTVADIIEDLLAKKSPMTKQEIMTGVLRQRYVKKGTISLNLQKNPHFVRVGRALYSLDSARRLAVKA